MGKKNRKLSVASFQGSKGEVHGEKGCGIFVIVLRLSLLVVRAGRRRGTKSSAYSIAADELLCFGVVVKEFLFLLAHTKNDSSNAETLQDREHQPEAKEAFFPVDWVAHRDLLPP
jgi:hypothetical protein